MTLSNFAQKLIDGPANASLQQQGIALLPMQLGAGGCSVVLSGQWCCHSVAVKISLEPIESSTTSVNKKELERGPEIWPFTREHPHITTLLWHGTVSVDVGGPKHLCTVWEQAEHSLKEFPLSDSGQIVGILRSVGSGLSYLHCRGVAHRDIKPANILIFKDRSGRPVARLADLGLARIGNASPGDTIAVGTPLFCHPRQFAGESNPVFDVYPMAWVYLDAVHRLQHGGLPLDIASAKYGATRVAATVDMLVVNEELNRYLKKVLTLDGNETMGVSVEELVKLIARSTEGETVDFVDDNQFIDFGFLGSVPSKMVFTNSQLESVDLSRSSLMEISAMAIGTDVRSLPSSIRANIDLTGVFRAKELASELRRITNKISNVGSSIDSFLSDPESTDNYDNLLRFSLYQLTGLKSAIESLTSREGQYWERFMNLATSLGELLAITLDAFGEAKRLKWPERGLTNAQREDKSLLSRQPNENEQLKLYRAINARMLADISQSSGPNDAGIQRPSLESETRQFYQALCQLLDEIKVA